MDEGPQDLIRGELSPDEKLLWVGRPPQGFVLRATDVFAIPFTLVWGGFLIYWEAFALAMGAPLVFHLFGVPLALYGLYAIFGRFWVDARQRAATHYAVTSERVVVLAGVFSRRVKSLSFNTLAEVSLTERGDGSGTITFGPVLAFSRWTGLAPPTVPCFEFVPCFELPGEARQVYQIILAAQRAAR